MKNMMKTIKECSEITGLPYSAIRNLCLNKKIRFLKSGTKYYIYLDSLILYCQAGGEAS
jgi:excisionase family DNA binding protein